MCRAIEMRMAKAPENLSVVFGTVGLRYKVNPRKPPLLRGPDDRQHCAMIHDAGSVSTGAGMFSPQHLQRTTKWWRSDDGSGNMAVTVQRRKREKRPQCCDITFTRATEPRASNRKKGPLPADIRWRAQRNTEYPEDYSRASNRPDNDGPIIWTGSMRRNVGNPVTAVTCAPSKANAILSLS